ncbi:hypothetical protein KA405_05440 [Patescibacteria group bacterium]|nr:hypothetical protein [Patescibacteria group bacterium]
MQTPNNITGANEGTAIERIFNICITAPVDADEIEIIFNNFFAFCFNSIYYILQNYVKELNRNEIFVKESSSVLLRIECVSEVVVYASSL